MEHSSWLTRDSGVIISEDGGNNWTTIPNSEKILYITNFFFKRNNKVIVSSYGRGLWIIDFNEYPEPLPYEEYCLGDCIMRSLDDPEILTNPTDGLDKDVTVFLNGRVNGLVLSGNEVKTITVTPHTVFKRYTGRTEEYPELNIVESEKGEGFNELKGCLAALENDEVIKAVILNKNKTIGIISGKQEFKEAEKDVDRRKRVDGVNPVDEGQHQVNSK